MPHYIQVFKDYESAADLVVTLEDELKITLQDYLLFPLSKEKCILITDDNDMQAYFNGNNDLGRVISQDEWADYLQTNTVTFSKNRGNLDFLKNNSGQHEI